MRIWFLVLFIQICGLPLWASESDSTYRRLVNFEWDAIPDAKSYELELTQAVTDKKETPKVFNFKTKDPLWSGRLTPGEYVMKLRSRDYRGVPGDWSPDSDFHVGLDNVMLKSPSANSKISTKESKDLAMTFDWGPVGGADKYIFELIDEDGKSIAQQELEKTSLKLNVPVAKSYSWKVKAVNEKGITSEATSVSQFTLLGKTLEKPKAVALESEYVRELKWSRPDDTESYDVQLLKVDEPTKKWTKFKTYKDYKEDQLPFDPEWSGGRYQIVVRAKGKLRQSSEVMKQQFRVHSGDRSPASEYNALVRRSIERVTGWYGIASYLVTQINFKGVNPEKNSKVGYDALGGTGRLGLGWFDPKNPWGFLGIIDMSGFSFNGSTKTYASAEFNAVYRKNLGDRSEVRFQFGPYYKEVPETLGDSVNNVAEDTTISAVGPHLGAEYWFSLSPKVGLQANAHTYMSLIKMSTPNGEALDPRMSYQIGFMGSYRFTPKLTGLLGYALRVDQMAYKVNPTAANSGGTATTTIDSGAVNEATITGHYLNIFAEWAF